MTSPSNLVEVFGKYTLPDGSPATGVVSFSPDRVLLRVDTEEVVIPDPIVATLSPTGEVALSLLSTDTPDVKPSGWSWVVNEGISGHWREWNLLLPSGSPPVDLGEAAPADPTAPEMAVYVRSVNGVLPDATGNVTVAGGGGGALSQLTDVDVQNAADGQVLTYSGGKWIPADAGGSFTGTRWWAAAGLPVTSALPGSKVGDFYIDTLTGEVYTLNAG